MRFHDLMRPVAALLLVFLATISPVMAGEMTIVYEEYPPYEYLEHSEVKGINVELIKEAFRRMGVRPTFESRPWKRALLELEQGKILALSSGFKTPQREGFAFFPSEPLAMESVVVIAAKDSGVKVASLGDLRGLRVGVRSDYNYGAEFDSMQGLNKVETNSNPQMLNMLLNKRADVIIGNQAVMRHLAQRMRILDRIDIQYVVDTEPLYLFFSKARGAEAKDLADRFGKVIKSMRKDGSFSAIEARY